MRKPTEIKKLQQRARNMEARVVGPDTLVVTSRTQPTMQYIVTIQNQSDGSLRSRCTCTWARHGGYACSHVLAALHHLAAKKHRAISFWLSKEDAERQKQRVLWLVGEGGGIWMTTRKEEQPQHQHEPQSA